MGETPTSALWPIAPSSDRHDAKPSTFGVTRRGEASGSPTSSRTSPTCAVRWAGSGNRCPRSPQRTQPRALAQPARRTNNASLHDRDVADGYARVSHSKPMQ
jgi:hypothetical protein